MDAPPLVPSSKFQLYSKIFPSPHMARLHAIAYVDAQARFSNFFSLTRLVEIFQAWASTPSAKTIQVNVPHDRKTYINYEFDKLNYRSTIFTTEEAAPNATIKDLQFHIKLANDGFLYKKPQDVRLRGPKFDFARHRMEHWYELDKTEFGTALAPLWQYAKGIFGLASDSMLPGKVFYNYEYERIDVILYDRPNHRMLLITFEPGYPNSDFDDRWVEM